MTFSKTLVSLLSVVLFANVRFASAIESQTPIEAHLWFNFIGTKWDTCSVKTTNTINRLVLKTLNLLLIEHKDDLDGADIHFDTSTMTDENIEFVPIPVNEGSSRKLRTPGNFYENVNLHFAYLGVCNLCKREDGLFNDVSTVAPKTVAPKTVAPKTVTSKRFRGLRSGTIESTDMEDTKGIFITNLELELSSILGALVASKAKKYACLEGFSSISVGFE